jgi:hypothetical protein
VGVLRGEVDSSARPITNGQIVVHGTKRYPYSSSLQYIEIYHTDIALPPGC